jgi:hypothetical protein
LDAADATTVTLSGSNVTQWRDKSGNLRHGTPVNGLTYSTASNGVVFTRASSQYLTLPDNTFPIGSSSFSIFFVFTPTATSYEIQLITAGARGGSIFGIRSGNAGTGTLQTFWSGGANDLQTSNLWAVKQRNIGALLYQTSGARSLWINGVQGASETSGGTSITSSNRIGTLEPGAFNTFDGQFHEVLVFESSLSVTERQQVEAYLAQKWDPVPSPLTIPGCVFWLDAGDRSTLTLSSSNTVTAWTEKSGANRTVTTNSTGIYSATAMNGRPGIQFSAGNVMTSSTAATLGNNLTAFVVFMGTSPGPLGLNIPLFVGSSANGYQLMYRGDFQTYQASQEGAGGTGNSHYTTINLPIMMAGMVSSTTPYWSVFLNGYANINPGVGGYNTPPVSNVGATTIYIPGGNPYWGGPGNGMFNGVISEVLLFSNALTTTQRQTVEGYLSSKWGIPIRVKPSVLPAAHAFPLALPALRTFSPLDIDGLSLWLDAADAAVFNGGERWTDKSGTDNHGVNGRPGSSTMPTVTTWPNGLTAARFVRASKNSVRTTNVIQAVNITYFFVVRITGLGSGKQQLLINNVDGQRQIYTEATSFPAQVIAFASLGNPVTNVISVAESVPFIYSATLSGGFNSYANGRDLGSGALAGSSASRHFFGSGDNDGEYLSCDYAEILIYTTALTTPQRQQVEGYLADKWGLRSSMGGVSHPFRFAPAVVLPSQIPGCSLWLDAADASSLTLSGSNVTAWRDKTGLTTLSLCNTPPTYVSNQVQFNASARFQGGYTMTQQTTVFAVYSTTSTSANEWLIGVNGNEYGSVQGPVPHTAGGYADLGVWTGGGWPAAEFVTTLRAQTGLRMYTVGFNGSNTLVWRNGTAATMIGSPATVTMNATMIAIGAGVGGWAPWAGALSELILFSNTLTTAQRQQMEGYLAWKWGLQANLPSPTTPWLQLKRALSPVFTPTQIPGCAFWIDAADAASMTVSGSNVTQWRDKSGNGHIGTAVASPVLTTVDGVPAVTFNGSSQYIDFGTAGSLGSNQFHIFTVSKFNTTADGSILARVANADQYYRYTMLRAGGVMYLATQADTGGYGSNASFSDTTTTRRLLSFSWDRSTITGRQNGTVVGTGSYANTATYTSSFKLLVAAYNNSSGGTPPSDGFYMNGSINEILFYFGPLTSSQRQRIEGYLAEKWGLRGGLGGTLHPHRYSAPDILPTQISGCVLWLDAADSATFTLSGSDVTQWRDKSGLGNHGAPIGTVTRTTAAFGGRASVAFNGSTIRGSVSITGPTLTVLAVYQPNALVTERDQRVVSFASPGEGDWSGIARTTGINIQGGGPSKLTTYRNLTMIAESRASHVAGVPVVGCSQYTGTAGAVFLDGVEGNALAATSGNFAISTYGLANQASGSPETLNGNIAEVVVYTTSLTTTQRQQIEGYLAWKWGLQATLPTSTHPYRTFKP